MTLLCLDSTHVDAQGLSNMRAKSLRWSKDTLSIDTLSMVPGSVSVRDGKGDPIDSSCFFFDWANGRLIRTNSATCAFDSVIVRYRVFPFNAGELRRHKTAELLTVKGQSPDPFRYQPSLSKPSGLFQEKGLNSNGSIARGISFGNNQDVFVNSSLNLQLSGPIGNNVELLAAITDENIPVQPEGNTQQLQE
ncbi:MAG: hypothetical protein ACKO7B_13990, partial [Flavobacteriales bacterium]